jgi:uncharacterized membrane protein YeiH
VFWFDEWEYLVLCVLTSLFGFFAWDYLVKNQILDNNSRSLFWLDTLGIGAFCCIGAQNAIRKGHHPVVVVTCGLLTSCFGGVIRDLLVGRPPRILNNYAELYGTCALSGSLAYTLARSFGASVPLRIAAGFGTAVSLRVWADAKDVRLPSAAFAVKK